MINKHMGISTKTHTFSHTYNIIFLVNQKTIGNQSSYLTGTKTTFFVEANARNMYAKYQLHKANSF